MASKKQPGSKDRLYFVPKGRAPVPSSQGQACLASLTSSRSHIWALHAPSYPGDTQGCVLPRTWGKCGRCRFKYYGIIPRHIMCCTAQQKEDPCWETSIRMKQVPTAFPHRPQPDVLGSKCRRQVRLSHASLRASSHIFHKARGAKTEGFSRGSLFFSSGHSRQSPHHNVV